MSERLKSQALAVYSDLVTSKQVPTGGCVAHQQLLVTAYLSIPPWLAYLANWSQIGDAAHNFFPAITAGWRTRFSIRGLPSLLTQLCLSLSSLPTWTFKRGLLWQTLPKTPPRVLIEFSGCWPRVRSTVL